MDTFFTISQLSESLYKVSGSKHFGFAFPIDSEIEIQELLKRIKKKYLDATHHCYAYKFGKEKYKLSDDGEPSGTAGKPIYGQILSAGITNVLIIVVRYYGGIKLGTGGLIDAYKNAARLAIEASLIIEKDFLLNYEINFEHEKMSIVMKIIKDVEAVQISQSFDLICNLKISIKKNNQEKFLARMRGLDGITVKFL